MTGDKLVFSSTGPETRREYGIWLGKGLPLFVGPPISSFSREKLLFLHLGDACSPWPEGRGETNPHARWRPRRTSLGKGMGVRPDRPPSCHHLAFELDYSSVAFSALGGVPAPRPNRRLYLARRLNVVVLTRQEGLGGIPW